jgi:hypothetical protein
MIGEIYMSLSKWQQIAIDHDIILARLPHASWPQVPAIEPLPLPSRQKGDVRTRVSQLIASYHALTRLKFRTDAHTFDIRCYLMASVTCGSSGVSPGPRSCQPRIAEQSLFNQS